MLRALIGSRFPWFGRLDNNDALELADALHFGLCLINFWQALGLLALSRILFGGFGSHHRRGGGFWQHKKQHWKQKMKDKWEGMPEEERAEWRTKFDRYCGGNKS